jgi:hypothetical protein
MEEAMIGPFTGGQCYVVSEVPFVAVVNKSEMNKQMGHFRASPKLYVVCFNPDMDQTEIRAVDWTVAFTLAPAVMRRLQDKIYAEYDRLSAKSIHAA